MPGVVSIAGRANRYYPDPDPPVGFDFYMSPTGTGDASTGGTISDPWPLSILPNATAQARYAGTVIGLLDGTYDESVANTPTRAFGVPLYTIAGGSSGSPTVLRSVNPRGAHITVKTSGGTYTGTKTVPPPFFNGFHQPHEGGVLACMSGGYVEFDGLRMSGEQTVLIRIGSGPNTTPGSYTLPGIVIKNCELFDCNDAQANDATPDGANISPIQMFNTLNAVVTNNYIHDIISWSATTADHLSGILLWFCSGTTVTYNTLVQAGGIYAKEDGTQGSEVAYNYISDDRNNAIGIQDFTGANTSGLTLASTFHHNVIVNPNGGGLYLISNYSGAGSGWTTELTVYNNTIYSENGANVNFVGGYAATAGRGLTETYNNLMLGAITIFERKPHAWNPLAPGKWSYNLLPASGNRWRLTSDATNDPDSGTAYSNIATMRTAVQTAGGLSSADVELNSVQSSDSVSDMFELTGTNADQYKVKTTSDAYQAGKSDGTTGGSTVNIGAWDGVVTQIGCDF